MLSYSSDVASLSSPSVEKPNLCSCEKGSGSRVDEQWEDLPRDWCDTAVAPAEGDCGIGVGINA
jgi:hypothetical protein